LGLGHLFSQMSGKRLEDPSALSELRSTLERIILRAT